MNNINVLKKEMTQWLDKYVSEEELNEFKRGQRRGSNSLLPYFRGEERRRTFVLQEKSTYEKYLNYPAMMNVWRVEAYRIFEEEKGYKHDLVTKIFNETISTIQDRLPKYAMEEQDKNTTGLLGIAVRHKKATVVCTVTAAGLTAIGLISLFFFAFKQQ